MPAAAALCRIIKDYIELSKPRITWLILLSTAIGFHFGAHGAWNLAVAAHTLMGTGLMAAGTFALNQWYERQADGRMRRTAGRPIPSGRITPNYALAWGSALSIAGFVELVLGANLLAGWLGAATLISYLLLYTPLKQRSAWCTFVGAFPGAMPPLIGFAGARGFLTPEAWSLFVILFLWQFPHFLSIAWLYREDYARANMMMLPVKHPDGVATALEVVLFAVVLVPASFGPAVLRMSGKVYMAGALLLGLCYLYSGIRLAFERTAVRARLVLLASVVYLPLIYGLMLIDELRPRVP